MGARFTIPKWGELAAALGVVVLFVVMLAGFFVPTYEGTDENGYMLTGKRLAAKSDVAKQIGRAHV